MKWMARSLQDMTLTIMIKNARPKRNQDDLLSPGLVCRILVAGGACLAFQDVPLVALYAGRRDGGS
jgi:hypothetical protein